MALDSERFCMYCGQSEDDSATDKDICFGSLDLEHYFVPSKCIFCINTVTMGNLCKKCEYVK